MSSLAAIPYASLPGVNALLNGTSACLLVLGYAFIRRGNVAAHKACMVAAVLCSTLFLASYLVYHAHAGSTRFQGTGTVRTVYFAVLLSHTVLAAAVPFLAAVTLVRALRRRFDAHARIARVTLPIWLYVSVTGVMIYLMLYRLYPAP